MPGVQPSVELCKPEPLVAGAVDDVAVPRVLPMFCAWVVPLVAPVVVGAGAAQFCVPLFGSGAAGVVCVGGTVVDVGVVVWGIPGVVD